MIVPSMCTISNLPSWVNIVSFYCYFGTFTSERGKVLLFSLGVLYLYGWLITELLTSIAYPTIDGGHVCIVIVVILLLIYSCHCKIGLFFFLIIFHGACNVNTEPIQF
ncbi:hypothetical protein AAZV13_17G102600 [Glycine max]